MMSERNTNICGRCGSREAYVSHTGAVLTGGSGSAMFDMVSLVAIGGLEDLPEDACLCDACVQHLREDGLGFAYESAFVDVTLERLPAKAYAEIFIHHALGTVEILRQNGVDLDRSDLEGTLERVERIRSDLEYDPSLSQSFSLGQVAFGDETVRLSRAHVLASLLVGAPIDKKALREAGQIYGERLARRIETIGEILDVMKEEVISAT